MEFHRIKYFLEVFRWGSFSKAAEHCFVSQPSLSQQIKKLEDELGGQLIQRSRDGVSLTPLGEKFLPHASQIANAVQAARSFADESLQSISGMIRIGAIPTIAPYFLPDFIRYVRSHYPEIQYDLSENTTDRLIERLRQGDIDFALLSPPTKIDDEVDSIELCEDELLVTVSREHALSRQAEVQMEDLESEHLLVLKETHCLTGQVRDLCRTNRIETKLSFSSSQMDTLLGFVELGLGVSFTPKMAIRHHSHRKVRFLPVSGEVHSRKIQLVWLRRNDLTVTQSAFVEAAERFQWE